MILFLDLKSVNARHREELIAAATRVIDSGWYMKSKPSNGSLRSGAPRRTAWAWRTGWML